MTQSAGVNVASGCLNPEENELLFTLIGSRKQTKATAVVQMFHASQDKTQWTKFRTGVACFVKDNVKKSYYIRLFDLATKSMVYEQEIYNQFTYKKDKRYFHSFAGDKYMVGLNFADSKEATKFDQAVEAKLHEREKKATLKRTKDEGNATPIARAPVNTVDAGMDPFAGSTRKAKPKRKGKISKADISAPSDFRHLSHVGFDPSTGAFDSSNIAPEWNKLLDTVGVTHEQLKDKNTANFIYDFVEKHGGIQEANRQLLEAQSGPPPPAPTRKQQAGRNQAGRGLPPPPPRGDRAPPSGRPGPPPPAPPAGSRGGGGGGGAPPPPPPPPPIGGPAPPPPPPMGGGGGGRPGGPPPPPTRESKPATLPVPAVNSPVNPERGNLLASIRKGTQLKKVTSEEAARGSSPPDEENLDGMAGALARALQQRNNVMQHSDSEEEEEWAEEEEDEWGSD